MRWVDADELCETLTKKEEFYHNGKDYNTASVIHMVKEICVRNAPTVDAEPVIRCEDCKYFMHGYGCVLQGEDYTWEEQMYADDFCSRGERK